MANIKDLIAKYKNLQKELTNKSKISERITIVAVKQVEAEYKTRIFNKGKATNGDLIGDYSTKPIYISPQSPNLIGVKKSNIKPIGKNGQNKFQNGKPHKTAYLANGYKELRQKTGRQSAKVDLNFSGSLFASIQTGRRGQFVVLGYTNTKKFLVMQGNEKRFKKQISALSNSEKTTFNRAARAELVKLVNETLKRVRK